MKELNVIVVGGGIGGLQTALALGSDGHKVTVLESVKEFLEVKATSVCQVLHANEMYIGGRRYSCTTQLFAFES